MSQILQLTERRQQKRDICSSHRTRYITDRSLACARAHQPLGSFDCVCKWIKYKQLNSQHLFVSASSMVKAERWRIKNKSSQKRKEGVHTAIHFSRFQSKKRKQIRPTLTKTNCFRLLSLCLELTASRFIFSKLNDTHRFELLSANKFHCIFLFFLILISWDIVNKYSWVVAIGWIYTFFW